MNFNQKPTKAQTTRVIAYCRVSTAMQRPGVATAHSSFDDQLFHIKNFVATIPNAVIYKVFQETASASDMKNTMMRDILSKEKDCLIVAYDVSRISRNEYQFRLMFSDAWTKNIRFATCSPGMIYENFQQIQEELRRAQEEAEAIGRRVAAAKAARKAAGGYVGGTVPFGMMVEKRGDMSYLVPSPHEEKVTRLIKYMCTPGTPCNLISQLASEVAGKPVPFQIFEYKQVGRELVATPTNYTQIPQDSEYSAEDISAFLNDNGITPRGVPVSLNKIKQIKRSTPLDTMNDMKSALPVVENVPLYNSEKARGKRPATQPVPEDEDYVVYPSDEEAILSDEQVNFMNELANTYSFDSILTGFDLLRDIQSRSSNQSVNLLFDLFRENKMYTQINMNFEQAFALVNAFTHNSPHSDKLFRRIEQTLQNRTNGVDVLYSILSSVFSFLVFSNFARA